MEQPGMLLGWLGLLSVLVLLGITWMLIQMSKLSEQLDTISAQTARRGMRYRVSPTGSTGH